MGWTRQDTSNIRYLNGFLYPANAAFAKAHLVRTYVRVAHPETQAAFPEYPDLMESYTIVDGVRWTFHNLFRDPPDPVCIGAGKEHYRWALIEPPE